jgi:hypothetical protein
MSEILYSVVDEDGRFIMLAPSDVLQTLLGADPPPPNEPQRYYDGRFGMLTITLQIPTTP